MLLEVAVESVEDARTAAENGADRLEICAELCEGGLTPATELVKDIQAVVSIPCVVMIRPRPGHFVYDAIEVEEMLDSISDLKKLNVQGFVLGVLAPDRRVDVHIASKLIQACQPTDVVFHRAFDKVEDPFLSLEALESLGVRRVLTSGGQPTALEGIPTIAGLVERSAGRIEILAGGGVSAENAMTIVNQTGVTQLHGAFRQQPQIGTRVRVDGLAVQAAKTILNSV